MKRPLIFGEVLFDCFGEGEEVLGGAAFNVAWHLEGFGLKPLLISRLGDDDRGHKVLRAMSDWQMDSSAIQIDKQHPTGVVNIDLHDGDHQFNILSEQAYDYIEWQPAVNLISADTLGLFYHGSLALRNEQSRSSQRELCRHLNVSRFVDINLRAPWWEDSQIAQLLTASTWAKLNHDELATVSALDCSTVSQCRESARVVLDQHQLSLLIVTLGKSGAFALSSKGEEVIATPSPVEHLADTVGAGDALSAVVITGLLQHWPLEQIVNGAVSFAAVICGIRGATTASLSIYQQTLAQWETNDS